MYYGKNLVLFKNFCSELGIMLNIFMIKTWGQKNVGKYRKVSGQKELLIIPPPRNNYHFHVFFLSSFLSSYLLLPHLLSCFLHFLFLYFLPSFFGVSLFLSLYFPLLPPIFSFPPPFFPIHLFIIHFPETVKLSDPGRVNQLTVTRTLILGVTCSVEHSLLDWDLSLDLGLSGPITLQACFLICKRKKGL